MPTASHKAKRLSLRKMRRRSSRCHQSPRDSSQCCLTHRCTTIASSLINLRGPAWAGCLRCRSCRSRWKCGDIISCNLVHQGCMDVQRLPSAEYRPVNFKIKSSTDFVSDIRRVSEKQSFVPLPLPHIQHARKRKSHPRKPAHLVSFHPSLLSRKTEKLALSVRLAARLSLSLTSQTMFLSTTSG